MTSSLAGFLKAEELSQITNVTESQALVAMREAEVGIPHHGGVLPKYKGNNGYILTDKTSLESACVLLKTRFYLFTKSM